jgi:hypothetical protein
MSSDGATARQDPRRRRGARWCVQADPGNIVVTTTTSCAFVLARFITTKRLYLEAVSAGAQGSGVAAIAATVRKPAADLTD